MANRHTVRRSSGVPTRRRENVWFGFAPELTTIAAVSTASLVGTLNAAALALRPFTIVRTRGRLHVRSDQISASEGYDISYGIVVVKDTATAIGITAVPTPVTDSSSDWLLYEQLASRFDFVTSAGFQSDGGVSKDFDSKAMRKVDLGDDVAIVMESSSVGTGQVVWDSLRMLIKLH